MAESQTDHEFQKIYILEARMRNTDRRESQNPALPCKKVEPSLIKDAQFFEKQKELKEIAEPEAENHKFSEFSQQNPESIDLKTNQKLQEIFVESKKLEKHEEKPANLCRNPAKLGSDSKKLVKRRLDLEFVAKKRPVELKFEEKSPISETGDELLGFQHNNLNNNTRITDFFELKPAKKPANLEKKPEKPLDFHSVRSSKPAKGLTNGLINDYFKKNKTFCNNKDEKTVVSEEPVLRKESAQTQISECFGENLRLKEEIRKLNKKILDKDSQIDEGHGHLSELLQENKHLQQNVKYFEESLAKYSNKAKETLCKLLLESEGIKRRELKSHLYLQRERLGEYVNQRQGHKFVDVWVDGYDLRSLKEKINKVKSEREELEKKKKSFKSKKNNVFTASKSSLFAGHFSDSETNLDSNSNSDIPAAELKNRISFQITMLQREEASLLEELKRLEAEKVSYIQQYKRQYEEDKFAKPDADTKLSAWPFLNKKYQVLSLLGKGGFSEVYKVFDLINYRENACKVHQLNPLWSEHNKSQYIKHALRETQTHRSLNHPNIVKLFETFELDANTLCTILEYCNGPDLSCYLKQNKLLQEKDAKLLLKQILYGLKYLHENQRKIIHYDLKPQNILFHAGEIKITDFGLCKVMESNTSLMELTSQGVGTYWYLPPECFEIADTPPKITTKVDIWSVGVILFEMVFGEKPFGNNMSQEKILKEQVILSADSVKFPQKPAVSAECKELIANCLVKNCDKRWDVNQCLNSSFFSKK